MSKRPSGTGLGVVLGGGLKNGGKPSNSESLEPLERLQSAFSLRQTNTPAILSEKEAAQLLGVNPDLMRAFRRRGLIEPLGDHGDQVPKRYAAIGVLRLMADEERLRAMDAAQTLYWKRKNAARSPGGDAGLGGALAGGTQDRTGCRGGWGPLPPRGFRRAFCPARVRVLPDGPQEAP